MRVQFQRAEDGRSYYSTIHRDDGVVLVLPGFDRKWRVPHDLAHAATERQLRIADGVFGSIAAGAMFDNMRVVSGRLRHDARQRSQRILRANSHNLNMAEVLAGVIHHVVESREHGAVITLVRNAWASRRADPFPYSATDIRAAVEELEELGQRWQRLAAGEALTLDWPRARVVP